MILKTKKTLLKKPLFLLTVASVFALSTAIGYCADERPDRANATVRTILRVAPRPPITRAAEDLAREIIQHNKKLFLSYCWKEEYCTKPMVDDFERFIKILGIENYYRDIREEEGLGLTLGAHIENFMKNARDADVTIFFLNDAYLRSRNCMYELLQVWDAKTRKVKPHAFIIRHPDFHGLFGGPDAAVAYTKHWREEYGRLADNSKQMDATSRQRHLEEMTFVTRVETNLPFLLEYMAAHIQADYALLRSQGFEDIFRIASTASRTEEEKDNDIYVGREEEKLTMEAVIERLLPIYEVVRNPRATMGQLYHFTTPLRKEVFRRGEYMHEKKRALLSIYEREGQQRERLEEIINLSFKTYKRGARPPRMGPYTKRHYGPGPETVYEEEMVEEKIKGSKEKVHESLICFMEIYEMLYGQPHPRSEDFARM
ncbi:MAG: hypothetical protein K0R76_987 [Alphaproteobacteria bacterium]|nr:hypothetical protein [Alphaproteobacteria bacterium]